MLSIKYVIEFGGKLHKLELYRTQKQFDKYAKAVIKRARSILDEEGKNASGNLRKSMNYEYATNKKQFSLTFTFDGADYWDIVEQGVQGAVNNKKAPNSPFKFGSGNGPKGKLIPAIDKWVVVKPIKDARDAKGRFIPRKKLVRAISSNIYKYGIQPTPFIRPPMRILFDRHKDKIAAAFASDVYHFFNKNLPLKFNIELEL
tara:strand:+ start:278 stop:883 length:606 start_codon:yes stop_codon:yes gene_type:complete